MVNKLKIFIFYFFVFFATSVEAARFYRISYKVREGENFTSILKKFVRYDAIVNLKSPTTQKIFKKNPQIKNWRELNSGEVIELYIEDSVMDLKKYLAYEQDILNKIKEAEEETKRKISAYPEGFKASFFYMASVGIFSQESPIVAKIKFYQNSPLSLGTSLLYYPKDSEYSFSGSLYYSKLTASAENISNQVVSVPAEIGGNAYLEYRWTKRNLTLFGGPDYETFSTFNMGGLQVDRRIFVDETSAVYATFGVSKVFTIFDQNFFVKTSISKSISSQFKRNSEASISPEFNDNGAYDGFKYLFYLNYKFSDKFFFHSLFKYHSMTGPSDLTTLRIGVGFGYVLF